MGYGARALQALNAFYSGEYFNLDEDVMREQAYPNPAAVDEVRTQFGLTRAGGLMPSRFYSQLRC